MLKKLIRANLDDLALCCGVIGSVFLLTHLVTAAALLLTGTDDSVLLSGVILPACAGLVLLFTSAAHVGVTFPMALKFGQTRRRALGLTLSVILFLAMCSMGLAALLTGLERLAAPPLWTALSGRSGWMLEGAVQIPENQAGTWAAEQAAGGLLYVEEIALSWYWFLGIAAAASAAGLIAGAILQRFGYKGIWIIWAVWMACCLGPQLLPWKQYTITNWLFPMIGALAIAGLVWSVWSLLHTVVKE